MALLLALAFHLRVLYRSPPVSPRSHGSAPTLAIRVVRPDVPVAATAEPRIGSALAAAPSRMAPTPVDVTPPTLAASAPAPTVASAASSASSAVRPGASSPTLAAVPDSAFSVGRLLDLLGFPLEAGSDAPERFFTGRNALPPAPDYLTAQQFEAGPQPEGEIVPSYPDVAGGRSGWVVLRLLIGASGTVDDVGVIQSVPPDVFDGAAISAFLVARFAPARLHGAPVKSQITVEVQFAPDELAH